MSEIITVISPLLKYCIGWKHFGTSRTNILWFAQRVSKTTFLQHGFKVSLFYQPFTFYFFQNFIFLFHITNKFFLAWHNKKFKSIAVIRNGQVRSPNNYCTWRDSRNVDVYSLGHVPNNQFNKIRETTN